MDRAVFLKDSFVKIVSFAVFVLVSAVGCGDVPGGDLKNGKKIFEKKCAYCHGAAGKGNGPYSGFLLKRPRDLTSAGIQDLSDTKLAEKISKGVPVSGMPAWKFGEKDMKDLVSYIRNLKAN